MPRWPKTVADYESDIMRSSAKIAKYTNLLENEKSRLEELHTKKRDAEMQELYEFMQASGMTAPEILKALQSDQD